MKNTIGLKYQIRREYIRSLVVFVGPFFVIYTFIFTSSLIQGLYFSLTDWSGLAGTQNFIGFDNYVRIFLSDNDFSGSLRRTGVFVLWNCLITNIAAMFFACLLLRENRSNYFSRLAIFLPNVISLIVTGFIWRFLLSQVVKQAYKATGFSALNINALGDPDLVIYSVVLVSLWAGIGYIMVIYIAALQSIDNNLVEASRIDGCSEWKTFWLVKMPNMKATVGVGIFLNIAGSIKLFDLVWSLTGGGPGVSSEVAMVNIYREAFERQNFGYGNAKSVLLTLIIMVITGIQLWLMGKGKND